MSTYYVCQILSAWVYVFKKIAPCQSWCTLLDRAYRLLLFSMSGLKEKQTYMKTETHKLHSRVF